MTPAKATPRAPSGSAAQQLNGFIAKFEPGHRALIRQVRRTVRKRLPTAHEIATAAPCPVRPEDRGMGMVRAAASRIIATLGHPTKVAKAAPASAGRHW